MWPDAQRPDSYPRYAYVNSFELAQEIARAAGRPLLVVQVGFPSRAGSRADPAVPRGPIDHEEQRHILEMLSDAYRMRSSELDGFAGVYLWSWSPDADAGGELDGGYSPQNKPAEKLLPRLFVH